MDPSASNIYTDTFISLTVAILSVVRRFQVRGANLEIVTHSPHKRLLNAYSEKIVLFILMEQVLTDRLLSIKIFNSLCRFHQISWWNAFPRINFQLTCIKKLINHEDIFPSSVVFSKTPRWNAVRRINFQLKCIKRWIKHKDISPSHPRKKNCSAAGRFLAPQAIFIAAG